MTKELIFDLHFYETVIQPSTIIGWGFCKAYGYTVSPEKYQKAVDAGLHVRFESASVRDMLASNLVRKEA